jgi:hypothetical protein
MRLNREASKETRLFVANYLLASSQKRSQTVIFSACIPNLRILAVLILLFATGVYAQVPTQSFANFEAATFDGWTLEGNAFGSAPATSATYDGKIRGFGGSRFLSSLHPLKGNTATGRAVSQKFTIVKPFITFQIGGGYHPAKACLNLVLDGKIVRTQTGGDSPQLLNRSWEVSEFVGKTAHIEIVDATDSIQRGYVLVDDIAFLGPDLVITPPVSENAPFIEIPSASYSSLIRRGRPDFARRNKRPSRRRGPTHRCVQ